jgi:hypothetical protein
LSEIKIDEDGVSGSVKNSVSSLTTLDRLGKGNRHEVKVEYRKV